MSILLPGNPGQHTEITVSFSSERRSWQEKLHIPSLLSDVLAEEGFSATADAEGVLSLPDGLKLIPRFVRVQPLDDGKGAKSTTTIQIEHPETPAVFEYQHTTGDTLEAAIRRGFLQWTQFDLPAFLDAVDLAGPSRCTSMAEAENGIPARRVILGHVWWLKENSSDGAPAQEHDAGCPCCFFTHCRDAFSKILRFWRFAGIRFFAMRDQNGFSADCRINGEDYPEAVPLLKEYAATWPGTGLELRKQYVIICDDRGDAPA